MTLSVGSASVLGQGAERLPGVAPSQNVRSGQSRQSFNLPSRRQVLWQNWAQFPVLRRSNSAPLGGWEEGEEQQEAEWACGTSGWKWGPQRALCSAALCFILRPASCLPWEGRTQAGTSELVAELLGLPSSPPAALVFCLPQELARGGLDGVEAEAGSAPSGPTAP